MKEGQKMRSRRTVFVDSKGQNSVGALGGCVMGSPRIGSGLCNCLLGASRIDSPPLARRVKFIYQEIGNDHSLAVVPTSIKQDHATRCHDGSPAKCVEIGE